MKKDSLRVLSIALLLFVNFASGEEKTTSFSPVFSGYASFQAGEVMKGTGVAVASGASYDHWWLQTGFAGIRLDAAVNDRFKVIAALEGELGFSFSTSPGSVDMNRQTELPRTKLNIKNAEGIYSFGGQERPFLQIEGGLFPYKYNPDARNLGEYLYRSTPYPQFVSNVFDRPYANIGGLRIGNQIGDIFHQDLMLTTEIQSYPLMDYSVSYNAAFSYEKMVTLGAGINLYRLIPVNGSETTPKNSPESKYYTTDKDSGLYTFSGTMAMGRISLDPKQVLLKLLPGFLPEELFGSEDLKVYSEAAILGLKNYPVDTTNSPPYYTKLSERIPLMIGFNVPVFAPLLSNTLGFHLLDLLNVELEIYHNRYPNSFREPYEIYVPVPTNPSSDIPKPDNLKWSVYLKRNCGKNFAVTLQIAHDHVIPESFSIMKSYSDRMDVLPRHGDWWWVAKTQCTF